MYRVRNVERHRYRKIPRGEGQLTVRRVLITRVRDFTVKQTKCFDFTVTCKKLKS